MELKPFSPNTLLLAFTAKTFPEERCRFYAPIRQLANRVFTPPVFHVACYLHKKLWSAEGVSDLCAPGFPSWPQNPDCPSDRRHGLKQEPRTADSQIPHCLAKSTPGALWWDPR